MNITICLTTANRQKLFQKALTSIYKLHTKGVAVIVGDNSKDTKSQLFVKKNYPLVDYFRNIPQVNEIKNSNRCINKAKTEIICLLHDDDSLENDYFNPLLKLMQNDVSIDLAYTGRRMVDENDRLITKQFMENGEEYYIYKASDILDHMVLGKELGNYFVPINTPGLVFRKRVFDKMGGFDENITTHCDTDFLLRSLSVAKNVLFINKPLYVSKIWFGLSGRSKSSETGEVFFTEKNVFDNFLSFCKKMKNKRYTTLSEQIYRRFSLDAIAVNGPLIWIAFRYKGSYLQKVKHILYTAKSIIKLNKKVLILPKFYFVLLLSIIIPSSLLQYLRYVFLKPLLQRS